MTEILLLIFLFLGAGILAVPIASRLGLGSVLGYLLAGIALSPVLRALHVDVVSVQHFAEFGVVMMLFLVGLELEPAKLWGMRGKLIGLGGAQVIATTLLIMGAAMMLGQTWRSALAIGLILCLSSTAIVLQTLSEKGLMKSDTGQNIFSVLLFQDIAVIPMLAFIPLLAMPGNGLDGHGAAAASESHGPNMSFVEGLSPWLATVVTLGAIVVVVLGGYYLVRPLFRFINWANLREMYTATALVIVVGIALLMMLVGLSPALGTFLAGVVLASSEYRHELESDIDPFRGLLLGVFFMTVGASVDFDILSQNLGPVLLMTAGVMALKAFVLFIIAVTNKMRGADKWLFSLSLAQAGEFGFVLISFTVASSVISREVADMILLVVTLSMLLTPLLFILYDKVIAPRYSNSLEREPDNIPDDGRIIIAGHGRVGGIVNRMLQFSGYSTTVLDYSAEQLEVLRTYNMKAYYGDATRPDLLHAAGIDKAEVIVVAIDNKEDTTRLVSYLVKTYPKLHVIARAEDRHHVYDLWAAGCRDIIRSTYDSSLRMGRSALEALGVNHELAIMFQDRFEQVDRQGLREIVGLYDPNIPAHKNKDYVEKVRELQDSMQDEIEANRKIRIDALRAKPDAPQSS